MQFNIYAFESVVEFHLLCSAIFASKYRFLNNYYSFSSISIKILALFIIYL